MTGPQSQPQEVSRTQREMAILTLFQIQDEPAVADRGRDDAAFATGHLTLRKSEAS